MKFCAIVCEYNPMHLGHVFHIKESLKISGCDGIAGFMSGNFSQRGEPTVLDKYCRAKIAVENGMDFVVGLPTIFSCQSAEIFALSAVKCINCFSNISHISFGSECGSIETLKEVSEFLLKPSKEFKKILKQNLKCGISYSASFEKTLTELKPDYVKILEKPNNLLGVEYLKALKATKSRLIPITIKRETDVNSVELSNSASAIRNCFALKKLEDAKGSVPQNSFVALKNAKINNNSLLAIQTYLLKTNQNLGGVYEVNEGIEKYLASTCPNFKPTSRYRINKINRTLNNICLNLNKNDVKKIYSLTKFPYLKLLATKKSTLNHINCSCPLIKRVNDIPKHKATIFLKLENAENNANVLYNIIAGTNLKERDLSNKIEII